MLFGQAPRLPVDDLLGRPAHTAAGTVDWVRQHRLQEAHHKAFDQLKQAAAKRARYTDKGAADLRYRWATMSTYATACWAATKCKGSGGPSCIG